MNETNRIVPTVFNENLLYNTVRIVGLKNNKQHSFGTGFFFHFEPNATQRVELILTNKHVINSGCDAFSFTLHEGEMLNNELVPTGKFFTVSLVNIHQYLVFPDNEVDLVAILYSPLNKEIEDKSKKIVYRKSIDDTFIKNDNELKEKTTVAEDVLMIGYPIGLIDEFSNFPIIRKGITSTHPALDFNNKSIGIVDIACFPGSSGSPIFISIQGSYPNKTGGISIGNKFIFLGLLYGGPIYSSEGKILIKEIPTSREPLTHYEQMIHLGYYVKAKEINFLCEKIKSLLNKNDKTDPNVS